MAEQGRNFPLQIVRLWSGGWKNNLNQKERLKVGAEEIWEIEVMDYLSTATQMLDVFENTISTFLFIHIKAKNILWEVNLLRKLFFKKFSSICF